MATSFTREPPLSEVSFPQAGGRCSMHHTRAWADPFRSGPGNRPVTGVTQPFGRRHPGRVSYFQALPPLEPTLVDGRAGGTGAPAIPPQPANEDPGLRPRLRGRAAAGDGGVPAPAERRGAGREGPRDGLQPPVPEGQRGERVARLAADRSPALVDVVRGLGERGCADRRRPGRRPIPARPQLLPGDGAGPLPRLRIAVRGEPARRGPGF